MRGPTKLLLFGAALFASSAGCTYVEDLLGTGDGGGGSADRRELQSITLESDHPAVPEEPGGAAVATDGALVRFTAVGHFVNLDQNDALEDYVVTGSVLWLTSGASVGMPASDGRMLLSGTGAVTVSARTPASGDIPEITSNPIVLTVLTAGTGS